MLNSSVEYKNKNNNNNNNNKNTNENFYSAVIKAEPLREFTQFMR